MINIYDVYIYGPHVPTTVGTLTGSVAEAPGSFKPTTTSDNEYRLQRQSTDFNFTFMTTVALKFDAK